MRILMLTSSYPLEHGDWRGCFVRELGIALMREGMTVEVAAPRPDDDNFAPPEPSPEEPVVHWLPERLDARTSVFHSAGIEANLMRNPLASLSLPPFLLAFAMEASLKALFADCLIAHWVMPMGVVGAALARLFRKPLVVVAHSAPPPGSRFPPMRDAVRFVVRQARHVACVSDTVRDAFISVVGQGLADRVVKMPIGVDLKPHARSPLSQGVLRVLFVGRLVRNKGVDVLLEALRYAGYVETTIIGDGPEAPSLREKAEAFRINVHFMGECRREEVEEAMMSHDILVVPSRRGLFGREEGMPRVILEAWACGMPVIASAVGGIPEALKDGGGLLVTPGDPEDLATAIRKVKSDARLLKTLGEEAASAALARSWRVLGPRWARLLS